LRDNRSRLHYDYLEFSVQQVEAVGNYIYINIY
jgi:hypothetical protein